MTQDMFDPSDLEMHWRIVEIHYELIGSDECLDFPVYIRTEPVDKSVDNTT